MFLGITRDGRRVLTGQRSHLSNGHRDALETIARLIPEIDSSIFRDRPFQQLDMGRVVGESNCIPVLSGDDVFYARRIERWGLTPFVRRGRPVPTTYISMLAFVGGQNELWIHTAWIGPAAPKEPWDRSISSWAELVESAQFWANHALVEDRNVIIPGTETSQVKYDIPPSWRKQWEMPTLPR